jgi:hypothetical protein
LNGELTAARLSRLNFLVEFSWDVAQTAQTRFRDWGRPMQSFDLEDGALARPRCRIAVSRRSLAGRLWALAALIFTIANFTTAARAEYRGDDDIWVGKRTLCYRLRKEVAEDKHWSEWIKQAIANWNATSDANKFKWKFEECPKDQKNADIAFKFNIPTSDYPKELDNRTNHQPVGEYAFVAEYRYADYGTYSATYGNPAKLAVSSDIRLRTQTATVGLSYSFGRN